MKTCKYGNFVAASSSSDHLEGKKTEGFILPPQKSSQTPSENFMNFCDEIVQNSKPVSHEEGHSHSGFGFKSGSNGENCPTPAGANNTKYTKQYIILSCQKMRGIFDPWMISFVLIIDLSEY